MKSKKKKELHKTSDLVIFTLFYVNNWFAAHCNINHFSILSYFSITIICISITSIIFNLGHMSDVKSRPWN